MTQTSGSKLLIRRLNAMDNTKLGVFFEKNNRIEVTRHFHPFPLTQATAIELLKPNRKDLFFGVEKNNRIVGYSMLRGFDEGFEIPSFGIAIDFDNQRKGLGKRLTEWTLRWADLKNYAKVRLSIYHENQAAYELYVNLGFKETSRSTHSNGLLRLVMERTRVATRIPIFISTQCLPAGEPIQSRLKRLYAAGLHHIELSNYPVTDNENFPRIAGGFLGQLMLHHFFPRGPKNLVLNLASANDSIRMGTLSFFKRGLDWSAACNAKYYSTHAGYITDPVGRDEHGFVFHSANTLDKYQALNRYTEGLITLALHAKKRKVTLLIENNVEATHHRDKLLLSTPQEFETFFEQWPANLPLGILLDWGHWQITAHTLQENLDGFANLKDRVIGLHLHSNNQLVDQHQPFKVEHDTIIILKDFNPTFVTLEGRYKDFSDLQSAALMIEKVFK